MSPRVQHTHGATHMPLIRPQFRSYAPSACPRAAVQSRTKPQYKAPLGWTPDHLYLDWQLVRGRLIATKAARIKVRNARSQFPACQLGGPMHANAGRTSNVQALSRAALLCVKWGPRSALAGTHARSSSVRVYPWLASHAVWPGPHWCLQHYC